MASERSGRAETAQWTVLRQREWQSHDDLVTLLSGALTDLETAGDPVIYDYIDAEAVVAVFGRGDDRGARGLRFECENYEVRLEHDGTVAARERPDAQSR